MRGYALGDIIKNGISLIYTKIIWRNARLVRLPILARNRKNIEMGKNFCCGVGCRINPGIDGKIVIGNNFEMGDYCQLEGMKQLIIGDNVLVGSRVYLGDSNHGIYSGDDQSDPDVAPNDREVVASPIIIEDNVWIGNAATVLGGVKIGRGSIVAANSVVVKDIPDKSIVAGNPAIVIKQYNEKSKKWERVKNGD